MDMEKWSRRLRAVMKNPEDREQIGRLTRDFGHLLPTASLQALRELRAELSALRDELADREGTGAAFAVGALFGLCEVASAYDSELRSISERRNLEAFARQELHAGLLQVLAEGVRLPGDLARRLATSDAQVSRVLKELQAAGLVEVASPEGLFDGRTRPRALTAEGLALARSLGLVLQAPPLPGAEPPRTARREPQGALGEAAAEIPLAAASSYRAP